MKTVSFVIPVYNEEENIQNLYNEILNQLKSYDSLDIEFIFVNDGSRDKSLEILKELSSIDKRVFVISFTRNFGHQSALVAGMNQASGDAVITMDCDFQDPPTIIPQMINYWLDGFKVVYTRRITRKDPFFKKYSKVSGCI